jgi:enoyl-CoA hydratase/carnithine racemase
MAFKGSSNMKSSTAGNVSPGLLRRNDAGGVATLTLAAPASRNALSSAMIEALSDALADIAEKPDLRAVVVAGEGPAFSSGHDLRELAAHRNDRDGGKEFYQGLMASCAQMMQAIVALPKPVIAAIEGVATAAGCQLVAACDLAIAGQAARFATPGVDIALFCSTPLVAIGRTISRKHAMEMALTGALYSADEAERFGLINRVVPAGEALTEARKIASELAARSAKTLAIGKKAFYEQIELNLGDAYARASQAMVENLLHADADEGIGAFLEKRRPHWEDE